MPVTTALLPSLTCWLEEVAAVGSLVGPNKLVLGVQTESRRWRQQQPLWQRTTPGILLFMSYRWHKQQGKPAEMRRSPSFSHMPDSPTCLYTQDLAKANQKTSLGNKFSEFHPSHHQLLSVEGWVGRWEKKTRKKCPNAWQLCPAVMEDYRLEAHP